MFNASRKKIAFAILIMTVLFLIVTLVAIYITSYLSLKDQSREMLERYIEKYTLGREAETEVPDFPPGTLPPGEDSHPIDGVLSQLSSFYSVAFSEEGQILAVDTGWGAEHPEEEVVNYARSVLRTGRRSGTLNHMFFCVEKRDGYTLVAFMDALLMEDSMRRILVSTLIAGVISVVLFFAASMILAKVIIRPLEENDRRQKQFVSDAGHELKTPIAVVNTNAELLSRQIGENQWLSNIQFENERMADLVKDLLVLSRAETGAVMFETIDLSMLIQQEVLPFESVAFEKGLTINCEIAGGIVVQGNRNQLGQLVSILTDNAISYSPEGNDIHISLKKTNRQAVLAVDNAGEGIPADTRERLFDRFYRCSEARESENSHFGLGLPIAKAITEVHRGDIRVECRNGRVVFSVYLPLNGKK